MWRRIGWKQSKIGKVVHIIEEWERMGGDSIVILKSGTIVKGHCD
jgi:hypothetical protein